MQRTVAQPTHYRLRRPTGARALRPRPGALAAVALCALLSVGAAGAHAQTTVFVTTASDVADGDTSSASALAGDPGPDGEVSLREALQVMDENNDIQVLFTGDFTINLQSDLPFVEMANNGLVDAEGQAVVLDGGGVRSGLSFLLGSNVTVRGLTFVNCANGVTAFLGTGYRIEGCTFGRPGAGNGIGLNLQGNLSATVGGTTPGAGNTFEDNDISLQMVGPASFNNHEVNLFGNIFGVDVSGANPPATTAGNAIAIQAVNPARERQIGGFAPGEPNVIAGNAVGIEANNTTNTRWPSNVITQNDDGDPATDDGLRLRNAANGGITPPTLTLNAGEVTVTGTGDTAVLFDDPGAQGATFVTSTPLTAGTATLTPDLSPVEGQNLTAIVIDGLGASGFAAPVPIPAVPPQVTAITRVDPSPTNAPLVLFEVTFSEPVENVPTSAPFDGFELQTTGTLNAAAITEVLGSGDTWSVAVAPGAGEGSVALRVRDDGPLADAAGLPLSAPFTGPAYDIARLRITQDVPAVAEAVLDEPFMLGVEVTGPLPIEYQWFRQRPEDDTPLALNEQTGATLEIETVDFDDQGAYFVRVFDANETIDSRTSTVIVVVGVPVAAPLLVWLGLLAALAGGLGGARRVARKRP